MTLSRSVRTAVVLLALPGLTRGDIPLVATVERVLDQANHEVPYPTELSRRIVAGNRAAENVVKSMVVRNGDAILTRTANSHVRLVEADRHAYLYSNTLVTFDSGSVWLLGHGGAYLVNRLGKLTVVVEGLARLSVNSEVYVRVSGGRLFAHVVEGLVTIEAGGAALALRPGEAARVAPNQAPARTTLDARDMAQLQKQIGLAQQSIPKAPAKAPTPPRSSPARPATEYSSRGGGGGGGAVLLGTLLGGGAAAGYFLSREEETVPPPDPEPPNDPTPSPPTPAPNPPTPKPPDPKPPTPAPNPPTPAPNPPTPAPNPPTPKPDPPGPNPDPPTTDPPRTDPKMPDLVVVPASPRLCLSAKGGSSLIRVDNLGGEPAKASSLSVVGSRIVVAPFRVPPLAPGQSEYVDVTSVVSKYCRLSCELTATVDPDGLVKESNEGNNVQRGVCGPG